MEATPAALYHCGHQLTGKALEIVELENRNLNLSKISSYNPLVSNEWMMASRGGVRTSTIRVGIVSMSIVRIRVIRTSIVLMSRARMSILHCAS